MRDNAQSHHPAQTGRTPKIYSNKRRHKNHHFR
nr:MAG TPA: hypothetical protein [Caudoviricetes sp.]